MTFFLDNCIPPKIGKMLRALDQDVRILREIYSPDTPDPEWMPLVARENWVVVSDDNRIRRKPSERQLLKELQLRVVFLPKGFANLVLWDQVVKIGSWWPKIAKEGARLQPGVCLLVTMNGKLEVLEKL